MVKDLENAEFAHIEQVSSGNITLWFAGSALEKGPLILVSSRPDKAGRKIEPDILG